MPSGAPNLAGKLPQLHGLIFIAVLAIALLFSGYFRFNSPLSNVPNDDEFYTMIPAVKLNVPHPNYDARMFNFHHPFFGFQLMGLLIERPKDYMNTVNIPPNLLYWSYMAAPELREEEASMRFMTALFGVLLLMPVFLIGKELYGPVAGLLAAAMAGVSVGFINLSRVLIQDAFLPFFMFMAIYFGIKYLKSGNEEKIFSISKPVFYFFATLVFIYLSFIIRLGQPLLVFLTLLLAVLMKKEKKYRWFFFYAAPLMALVVIISFGIEPFARLLELRGENIASLRYNTEFVLAGVSQGSFTFLLMAAFTAYLFAADFLPKPQKKVFRERLSMREIRDKFSLSSTSEAQKYIEMNYESRKEQDGYTIFEKKSKGFAARLSDFFMELETEKKFILMSFALMLLGIIFTETGGNPRLYMFFFIFPIIFVAGKIARFKKTLPYAMVCAALILDIGLLHATNPNFSEYTVLGMKPSYLTNFSAEYSKIFGYMGENGNPKALSNEPGFLLRYPDSEPLPVSFVGFREYGDCTPAYAAAQKGNFLVYRAMEYDINANKYICPNIPEAKPELVKTITNIHGEKMFQIYRFG